MESILIKDDGCFDLPDRFQDKRSLTIRMPYAVKHYAGQSIATYFRQPGKEPAYVDDGFIEIRCDGATERFKAVDKNGVQVFWVKK
jgi:hypothetical protein